MKEWIKAARLHAELTQLGLAERLGVTKGNISAWEQGRHEASLEQITKIADLTNFQEPLGFFTADPSSNKWKNWPFEKVSEEKIKNLSKGDVIALEAALILAAAQLDIDIKP